MLNFITSLIDWFFFNIDIHRNIFPLWYIATGLVLITSIILAIILRLKRFGFWVLISAAMVSAIWELFLFFFGMRDYNNPLAQQIGWIPELIYHSFSETAATFLLGLLIIYKLGIIDLEKYKDKNWKKRIQKNIENENNREEDK
ncbi:MAG: hypothetical protein ACTSQP_05355 [Promethearchaeota archaeon]